MGGLHELQDSGVDDVPEPVDTSAELIKENERLQQRVEQLENRSSLRIPMPQKQVIGYSARCTAVRGSDAGIPRCVSSTGWL